MCERHEIHDRLEGLIQRLETVVNGNERPVTLHWSDVELLRALRLERLESASRVLNLRRSINAAITREVGGGLPGLSG